MTAEPITLDEIYGLAVRAFEGALQPDDIDLAEVDPGEISDIRRVKCIVVGKEDTTYTLFWAPTVEILDQFFSINPPRQKTTILRQVDEFGAVGIVSHRPIDSTHDSEILTAALTLFAICFDIPELEAMVGALDDLLVEAKATEVIRNKSKRGDGSKGFGS